MIRNVMKAALIALAAVSLTGCSSEQEEPAPAPTGYAFAKDDLYADPPRDNCRVADREFLQKLLDQVKAKLSLEQAQTLEFRDFNVTDDVSGNGREATLRFTVSPQGQPSKLMYATGRFVPEPCGISGMKVGEGASPYAKNP